MLIMFCRLILFTFHQICHLFLIYSFSIKLTFLIYLFLKYSRDYERSMFSIRNVHRQWKVVFPLTIFHLADWRILKWSSELLMVVWIVLYIAINVYISHKLVIIRQNKKAIKTYDKSWHGFIVKFSRVMFAVGLFAIQRKTIFIMTVIFFKSDSIEN